MSMDFLPFVADLLLLRMKQQALQRENLKHRNFRLRNRNGNVGVNPDSKQTWKLMKGPVNTIE